MTALIGHLAAPSPSPQGQELLDDDLAELGFVMNASRLWAYQPAAVTELFDLMKRVLDGQGFSRRQIGVVVAASASTAGDSYCSLAWGTKLAAASTPAAAAGVLAGRHDGLPAEDAALAAWTRRLITDPSTTSAADVDAMRSAGWSDAQLFAITVFAALRLAFSTVNSGLGVGPDAEFAGLAPSQVRAAVTYGRPIDGGA